MAMHKFDDIKVQNETFFRHYDNGITIYVPLTAFASHGLAPDVESVNFVETSEQGQNIVILELPNRKRVQMTLDEDNTTKIKLAPGHDKLLRKVIGKSSLEAGIRQALQNVMPEKDYDSIETFLKDLPVIPLLPKTKQTFFKGSYTLAQKYAVDDVHSICVGGGISVLALETVLKNKTVDLPSAPQEFFEDVHRQVKNHFTRTGLANPDMAATLVTATAIGASCPLDVVRQIKVFALPVFSKDTDAAQSFISQIYDIARNPELQHVFVSENDDDTLVDLLGAGNTRLHLSRFGRILGLDKAAPGVTKLAHAYASQCELGISEMLRTGRDPIRVSYLDDVFMNEVSASKRLRAAQELFQDQSDFIQKVTRAVISSYIPYYGADTANRISQPGVSGEALDEITENVKSLSIEHADEMAGKARLSAALSAANVEKITEMGVSKAPAIEPY